MAKKIWTPGEELLASDLNNNFSLGWETLADVNLTSAAATLESSAFAAKTFLKIFVICTGKAATDIPSLQFNGDTTTKYSFNNNGGSSTGNTHLNLEGATSTRPIFAELSIANLQAISKSIIGNSNAYVDASSTPTATTIYGVWENTDQITAVTLLTNGGANLNAGTRLVIVGRN